MAANRHRRYLRLQGLASAGLFDSSSRRADANSPAFLILLLTG